MAQQKLTPLLVFECFPLFLVNGALIMILLASNKPFDTYSGLLVLFMFLLPLSHITLKLVWSRSKAACFKRAPVFLELLAQTIALFFNLGLSILIYLVIQLQEEEDQSAKAILLCMAIPLVQIQRATSLETSSQISQRDRKPSKKVANILKASRLIGKAIPTASCLAFLEVELEPSKKDLLFLVLVDGLFLAAFLLASFTGLSQSQTHEEKKVELKTGKKRSQSLKKPKGTKEESGELKSEIKLKTPSAFEAFEKQVHDDSDADGDDEEDINGKGPFKNSPKSSTRKSFGIFNKRAEGRPSLMSLNEKSSFGTSRMGLPQFLEEAADEMIEAPQPDGKTDLKLERKIESSIFGRIANPSSRVVEMGKIEEQVSQRLLEINAIKAFMRVSPEGMCILSSEYKFIFLNQSCAKIFGMAADQENLLKNLLKLKEISSMTAKAKQHIENRVYEGVMTKKTIFNSDSMSCVSEEMDSDESNQEENFDASIFRSPAEEFPAVNSLCSFKSEKSLFGKPVHHQKRSQQNTGSQKWMTLRETLCSLFSRMDGLTSKMKTNTQISTMSPFSKLASGLNLDINSWKKSMVMDFDEKNNPVASIGVVDFETFFKKPNGKYELLKIKIIPIYYEHKPVLGMLISKVTAKETLGKMSVQLDFKAKTLANVSHELRTPLHGISSFLNMAKESLVQNTYPTDYIIGDLIEPAIFNTQRLCFLVNSYLDLSQIRAGEKQLLHKEGFSLKECLQDCLKLIRINALSKKIDLYLAYSSMLPLIVVSDKNRISQVVINLLGNALKFTKKGHIKVSAEPDKEQGMIKIAVEDTGQGIKTEDKNKLFREFGKIDYGDNPQGIGLGLVISNNIAKLLAEDEKGLRFTSDWGKGSKFFFFVKNMKNDEMKSIKEENIELASDKFTDFDWIPSRLMQKMNQDNLVIKNKFASDRIIRNKSYNDTPFPGNGLRFMKEENRKSPIRRKTDKLKKEERKQDDFFVESEEKDCIDPSSKEMPDTKENPFASLCGHCFVILAVDDDAMNISILKMHLKSLSVRCETATSKGEALQLIQKRLKNPCSSCKSLSYQLIFMDVELDNGNSGLELAKEIKEGKNSKEFELTKIIACTGHSKTDIMGQTTQEIIEDVLQKPYSKEQLQSIMLKCFGFVFTDEKEEKALKKL